MYNMHRRYLPAYRPRPWYGSRLLKHKNTFSSAPLQLDMCSELGIFSISIRGQVPLITISQVPDSVLQQENGGKNTSRVLGAMIWRRIEGENVELNTSIISALDEDEWSRYRPLCPVEDFPDKCLDMMKRDIFVPTGNRTSGNSNHIQSLYWVSPTVIGIDNKY